MLKLSTNKLEDNDRYEGFGIDLIKELSEMSGFNYTFILQEDLSSGYINEQTKQWTGMIGEVISGVRLCRIKNFEYFQTIRYYHVILSQNWLNNVITF